MALLGHPHRPAEDDAVGLGECLGRRGEFFRRHARQVFDFFGRERLDFLPDFLEVPRVAFDEVRVVEVVFDDVPNQAVEPGHVVAGVGPGVLVGVFGDADFPRVEHDEVGPVADVLLDSRGEHRV